MKHPNYITIQNEQLIELMNKDCEPYLLPKDVAKFLGMDVDTLRTSAENGTCPFAIGGRAWSKGNRFTKIPKLAFYNWITQGALYKE